MFSLRAYFSILPLFCCVFSGGLTNPAYVHDDEKDDGDEEEDASPVEPNLPESVLPWMRQSEDDVCEAPLKQREFPAWLKNEEYMPHGSPSSDILGLDSKREREKEPKL